MTNLAVILVAALIGLLHLSLGQEYSELADVCPNIYPKVFVGFGPKGNDSAGNYEKKPEAQSFRECVELCCEDDKCNVVFMYLSTCFLIECMSNEMCVPISRSEAKFRDVTLVLVAPLPPETSWASYLDRQQVERQQDVSNGTHNLVVSVLSKTVQLPEDAVTLSVFTVPSERAGEHFVYNWKLLSQPEDTEGASGTIKDGMNGATLKLTHLAEGLYTFKVTVTAPQGYGETTANVTVLPRKRINEPPVAVITPSAQTVKLPNTGAVLDGSPSTDDDAIVSWHWALQSGPLGYQATLDDTPTIQLNDLTPGNYTFKLTVEDSDHATNSSTANVTVVKVTDYPPEANAGQDVIVYLPHNSVTLNGNLSTDDRGVTSWEWTKSPSDQDKAVDMQKTRTPYLELSNLEEGMYTFTLKVTDDNGQSSSSDVHVFVKPPTNKPPQAVAGSDVSIALPQTWALLDGSASSDDVSLVSYAWRQLSGPTPAVLLPANSSHTNATGLTKGQYRFQLTVTDSDGNLAVDSVTVTVTQNENAAPKANAGGDRTVTLPVPLLTINGSASSDDLAITRWQWRRDPTSQALGQVLANSDSTPLLMVTGLVEGRYVFRLTVTDGQGLTDEDTVSVIVKSDPAAADLVELTLNVQACALTLAQQISLESKLRLLLHDQPLNVRELKEEQGTGRAMVVFSVAGVSGPEVVAALRDKLRQDQGLVELSVASVRTVVCQNMCSGHGVCEQATRACLCEAFWMQSPARRYLGDGDPNCDWSILYVVVGLFVGVVLLSGSTWALVCLVRTSCIRPRPRQRYSLIDDGEDGMVRVVGKSAMLSETDSDSDVLFNRRDKSGHTHGHNRRPKNGFLGRRVNT